VSESQLIDYITNQSSCWERQAYLRARPLFDTIHSLKRVVLQKGLSESERLELVDIKKQLLKRSSPDEINLKYQHGGLVDIELAVQARILQMGPEILQAYPDNVSGTRYMIEFLANQDESWRSQGQQLLKHYQKLRLLEQMFQLTSNISRSHFKMTSAPFRRLAKALRTPEPELTQQIQSHIRGAHDILKDLDPTFSPS
jgi:glutamate-ammonia-ligase adenylyltransferase